VLAYFTAQPSPAPAPFPQLTERERAVLELVAQGRSNAVIAARLQLSQKTIRNYVSNILAKLQVADRAQAIIRARNAGLGHPPPAVPGSRDRQRAAKWPSKSKFS
jgi:DNA-binding NarL/FixJ family response regulator